MSKPTPHALDALDGTSEWLNSEPLTAAALRGRVVAVQFCTYSCINWIRTLPYVRAWAARYRELVVIGAHAPEFAFERERGGVRRALEAMGVEYPVVLDNDYAIWTAFGNHYWPALYVLDGEGTVRHHAFGEGGYEESEAALQRLLGVSGEPVRVQPAGVEAAADWEQLESPETYLGRDRGERRVDRVANLNQWALAGAWAVEAESAVLEAAGGSITYRFGARDLNLVLTGRARFSVRLDGDEPGPAHGVDVDATGAGLMDGPRLYQLIRQPGPVRERTFEITFDEPDVRAYVLTFG